MESLFEFIRKLINTFKYNWFYIVLSLFFPFILWNLDQGKDIVYNLFLDDSEYGGINLSLALFAFTLMSYSLWCIPTLAINIFTFFTSPKICDATSDASTKQEKGDIKLFYFKKIVGWYNNKTALTKISQFPMRYFAILPFIIFMLSVVTVIFGNTAMVVFLILFCVVFYLSSKYSKRGVNKFSFYYIFDKFLGKVRNKKSYYGRFLIIASLYILLLMLPLLFGNRSLFDNEDVQLKAIVFCFIAIVVTISLFQYFRFLENFKPNTEPKKAEVEAFKITQYRYIILLVILLTLFIVLSFMYRTSQINLISPIVVIVILTTLIIFIADLFFTSQLVMVKISLKYGKDLSEKGEKQQGISIPNNEIIELCISKLGVRIFRIFVYILILFAINTYFFNSINENRIRRIPIVDFNDSLVQQSNLENYFTKWISFRNYDTTNKLINNSWDDTLNVYLVSGQGGGSRAGIWFYTTMLKIDSTTDNTFYQNTFSYSTVSGSSSGAEMYVASKYISAYLKATYLLQDSNLNKFHVEDTIIKYFDSYRLDDAKLDIDYFSIAIQRLYDSIESIDIAINDRFNTFSYNQKMEAVKTIYSKNYVSSAMYGILLGDLISGLENRVGKLNRDRNFYFQNEEINGFYDAFRIHDSVLEKLELDSTKFKLAENLNLYLKRLCRSYFLGDYMNLYAGPKSMLYPMLLLNTTVVDNGTKGVFSPVYLNGFSLYKDVYKSFRACDVNDKYGLPLVAAVNQSQAFPIINAYNYIHDVGRTGDGGFYENTGNSTTIELYRKLRIICKRRGFDNIKFTIVSVLNSSVDASQSNEMSKSTPLTTIKANITSPFNGHQAYAQNDIMRQVNEYFELYTDGQRKDRAIKILLNGNFTLNRVYSRTKVEDIIKQSKTPEFTNLNSAKEVFKKDKNVEVKILENVMYNMSDSTLQKAKELKESESTLME